VLRNSLAGSFRWFLCPGTTLYMPGPRTWMDNQWRGMELSKKAGVLGRPRASADYKSLMIRKETKRTEELKEDGYETRRSTLFGGK